MSTKVKLIAASKAGDLSECTRLLLEVKDNGIDIHKKANNGISSI